MTLSLLQAVHSQFPRGRWDVSLSLGIEFSRFRQTVVSLKFFLPISTLFTVDVLEISVTQDSHNSVEIVNI